MYKVVKRFYDLKDNGHAYSVGDTYPWNNADINSKRVAELASHKNKIGVPLIVEIVEEPKKKATKKIEKTKE